MNKKTFTIKIEKLISQIEDIISELPYQGDKETNSQKIYLLNTLNKFSYAVNGIEESDFQEIKIEENGKSKNDKTIKETKGKNN